MKQIAFTLLFATLFVVCACDDDSVIQPNNGVGMQEESIFKDNKIFTIDNTGATIIYQSRIGYTFDSALDSLIRRYEPIFNTLATEGHYSGEGVNIDKEEINVDFSYDDRTFKLLTFTDKANVYQVFYACDVIDEKGNYYRLVCPDD